VQGRKGPKITAAPERGEAKQNGNIAVDAGTESLHVRLTFHPPHAEAAMRTYLITYDCPCTTRHGLSAAIMQLGEAWARPLQTTWYVQSPERPEALLRRLAAHLDSEEGLVIQQVDANAVLTNTALRWFRKRRQESGVASNVVAFPPVARPNACAA
jgi:hypothetical protein